MSGKNSSNSSAVVEGNTSKPQPPPKKYWCFTLNNYTSMECSSIISIIKATCEWAIVGIEVGVKGTPHLQGAIAFYTKKRASGVFKNKRIHWEGTKGSKDQNIEYCSKEGNILFRWPEPVNYPLILSYKYQNMCEYIINHKICPRSIYWFYDEKGNTQKTFYQKRLVVKYNALILGGNSTNMKHGVVNYIDKHKRGPELIVINATRADKANVSYKGIEEVKDGLFFSGKYDSNMVCYNNPHLIVFANYKPKTQFLSEDRWIIYEINDTDQIKPLMIEI